MEPTTQNSLPTPTHTDTLSAPVKISKEAYSLGKLPMPDSIGQKEGTQNQLSVEVHYLKDRRQGRGIYLILTGGTRDGVFMTHRLMRDPAVYHLVEPCARFSAKTLETVALTVPFRCTEFLEEKIAGARSYYATTRFL